MRSLVIFKSAIQLYFNLNLCRTLAAGKLISVTFATNIVEGNKCFPRTKREKKLKAMNSEIKYRRTKTSLFKIPI